MLLIPAARQLTLQAPLAPMKIKEQYNYYLEKVIYGEMTADEAAKAVYDFAASKF